MSVAQDQHGITHRVDQRPSVDTGHVREIKKRDLAVRFTAGALASMIAAGLTLAFGARIGGLFLAFPAILAASLTLIEEQEDAAEAREDARGAVVGGVAMAVFAAIVASAMGHMNGGIALALATLGWFLTAGLVYLLAWFK